MLNNACSYLYSSQKLLLRNPFSKQVFLEPGQLGVLFKNSGLGENCRSLKSINDQGLIGTFLPQNTSHTIPFGHMVQILTKTQTFLIRISPRGDIWFGKAPLAKPAPQQWGGLKSNTLPLPY